MALSGVLDEMESDDPVDRDVVDTVVPLAAEGVGLMNFHRFINRCALETKLFEAGRGLRADVQMKSDGFFTYTLIPSAPNTM